MNRKIMIAIPVLLFLSIFLTSATADARLCPPVIQMKATDLYTINLYFDGRANIVAGPKFRDVTVKQNGKQIPIKSIYLRTRYARYNPYTPGYNTVTIKLKKPMTSKGKVYIYTPTETHAWVTHRNMKDPYTILCHHRI